MVEKSRARSLWNGDRFSLENSGGVYVIKTYKEGRGSILTTRAERRLTTKTSGFLGMGKRWKMWGELSTPVEVQDIEQEVTKVAIY